MPYIIREKYRKGNKRSRRYVAFYQHPVTGAKLKSLVYSSSKAHIFPTFEAARMWTGPDQFVIDTNSPEGISQRW